MRLWNKIKDRSQLAETVGERKQQESTEAASHHQMKWCLCPGV